MVDFSLPFHRFTRGHGVQLKDDGAWRRQGQQISKLIGLGDAKSRTSYSIASTTTETV
jgi:hypothetical protein